MIYGNDNNNDNDNTVHNYDFQESLGTILVWLTGDIVYVRTGNHIRIGALISKIYWHRPITLSYRDEIKNTFFRESEMVRES